MKSFTIALSEEQVAQLESWANDAGIAPEELLRRRVEKILETPDISFDDAAKYVLKKNEELYRRLA